MVSIGVVSLLILISIFRPYQIAMLRIVGKLTNSNRYLIVFMIGILVIPVILLFL